jgi:hypothetical protein
VDFRTSGLQDFKTAGLQDFGLLRKLDLVKIKDLIIGKT